jgi:hypothetical protein
MNGGHNHNSDVFESVHRFVAAGAGDDLTDSQWADFERLLREDGDAKRIYAKYVSMLVLLPSVLDSVGDDESPDIDALFAANRPDTTPAASFGWLSSTLHGAAGSFATGWPVAYLVATVIFAIGLTIGAFTYVSQPAQVVKTSPEITNTPRTAQSKTDVIARITGMVNCQWAENETPPSPLVALGDKFALLSGLMEITYDLGAKVILQGPATYEVDSDGGFLAIGKLTADLEKRSAVSGQQSDASNPQSLIPDPLLATSHDPLFTIKTPTAIVTDLGTEFGVEVQKTGLTFAHVFRGTIEVRPVASLGQPGKAVQLSANDSVRVAGGGRDVAVHRDEADPAAFVRHEQIRHLTEERKLQPLQRWRAQAEAIRHDPALVVYYDFQRHADSPEVLHAEATSAGSKLDGIIEGAVWAKGRMPGKDALQFDGDQSRVRVKLPQRIEALTLATWINITSAGDFGSAVLAPDGWGDEPGKCNVQITREGNIHFDTTTGVARTGPVLPWPEWSKKRWRHLAVVVNPSREQVAWFLDSGKVYEGPIAKNFFTKLDSASIGNWWSTRNAYERGFGGRIDELIVLGRAMSEQEIQATYEAGKP